jgi:Protein of unknown function (DUF1761)
MWLHVLSYYLKSPIVTTAVQLGFWLWFGFVFMILVGAVAWDNVPWKLTAIHAGDWLVKLPLMAVILAAWHR